MGQRGEMNQFEWDKEKIWARYNVAKRRNALVIAGDQ